MDGLSICLFQKTVMTLQDKFFGLHPVYLDLIRIRQLLISGSLFNPKLSFLALACRIIPEISPDCSTRKFQELSFQTQWTLTSFLRSGRPFLYMAYTVVHFLPLNLYQAAGDSSPCPPGELLLFPRGSSNITSSGFLWFPSSLASPSALNIWFFKPYHIVL